MRRWIVKEEDIDYIVSERDKGVRYADIAEHLGVPAYVVQREAMKAKYLDNKLYTEREDEKLRLMCEIGLNTTKMSLVLDRSRYSVVRRLRQLELV